MPKKIDVNVSSLIDLKAELFRKTEAKKGKGSSVQAYSCPPSSSTAADLKLIKSFTGNKKPLVEKGRVQRPGAPSPLVCQESAKDEEEARRLHASRSRLEEKARIYQRMQQGEKIFGDERNEDARCLVNFTQKIREEEKEEVSDPEDGVLDSSSNPEEEWVEFTDSLGRSRHCMKKDLPTFQRADREMKDRGTLPGPGASALTKEADAGRWPSTAGTEELSTNRGGLESEEPHDGPLHYQHVLRDEAREHGVAYMQFSHDESTRQEQMKELDALRKQTIESRNRNERMKGKRKELMAQRLARVRQRKKLRLQDGEEDPLLVSSDEETEKSGVDPASIPLPEESMTEEEKRKVEEDEQKERRRLLYVRPWDKEKKIMMVEPLFHYQFRLILIGDSTVGKSSLLKYFTEGRFAEICDPTVGVDFYARLVEIKPGLRIKLQLWDTAGQEKFRSITRSYYRNSVGVIVVYDITKRSSFEHVAAWLHEARSNIGSEPGGCAFQLVGHKSDLESERQVLYEEGEYFAKHHHLKFLETSAMSGQNVEEAFLMIARDIHHKLETGDIKMMDGWDGVKSGFMRRSSSITLSEPEEESSSFCGYC